MALSNAEKVRRYRERQKAALKNAADLTHPLITSPFYPAAQSDPNWSDIDLAFDLMGIEPPQFNDDAGPKSFGGEIDDHAFEGYPANSLGRAEVMADALIDAAGALTLVINRFKQAEVQKAIEASVQKEAALARDDVAGLKAAWAELKALHDVLEKLRKQTRRFFFTVNVKE